MCVGDCVIDDSLVPNATASATKKRKRGGLESDSCMSSAHHGSNRHHHQTKQPASDSSSRYSKRRRLVKQNNTFLSVKISNFGAAWSFNMEKSKPSWETRCVSSSQKKPKKQRGTQSKTQTSGSTNKARDTFLWVMHALGGKGKYSQVQAIIDISYYLKDNTSQRTKEGYALVNSK